MRRPQRLGFGGWTAGALLLAMPGCLGVAYFGTHYGCTSTPRVSSTPGRLIAGSDRKVLTEEELRRRWGEPDEVMNRGDGTDRWTYTGGLRWKGILLCAVIVPIPLIVPVGREQVTIEFRSGEAVFGDAIASEDLWEAFAGWHLHRGWTAFAGGLGLEEIPTIDLPKSPE